MKPAAAGRHAVPARALRIRRAGLLVTVMACLPADLTVNSGGSGGRLRLHHFVMALVRPGGYDWPARRNLSACRDEWAYV
ncbi:hypothetical protein [Labrys wisconsinensis]|uniref:Uncharacterized protein n=1 Tax=Labrys wisconsinensis TaxID=425677 RepID=A0ABU0JFD9_9HYPH|nr:hypothetical protein [Labrys wisconsinensis]MDQ0473001.1 hypothetical protein [Labrys wisconsinensis]